MVFFSKKNWERDELFASMLKLSKLKINTMLKRFREPYRRYVWNEFGNMAVIDAYYTPILNAIGIFSKIALKKNSHFESNINWI